MGNDISHIPSSNEHTTGGDTEVKDEPHMEEEFDVRNMSTGGADRSLGHVKYKSSKNSSQKSPKTSRKRKSQHSEGDEDSVHNMTGHHPAQKEIKTSPTQEVETSMATRDEQTLQLEHDKHTHEMSDHKTFPTFIGPITEKPQTNITSETIPEDANHISRARRKSKKKRKSRKSAVLKLEDDDSGLQEIQLTQSAEGDNGLDSLHKSRVEAVNSVEPNQALIPVHSDNGVDNNNNTLEPLQSTPGSKIRSGLQESLTIKNNAQNIRSPHVPKKKRKHNTYVPEVNISVETPLKNTAPLGSRIITNSSAADLSTRVNSSSPPCRATVPVPLDPPKNVKRKGLKKRKRQSEHDSDAMGDRYSENTCFPGDNSRTDRSPQEDLPPSPLQNALINLMNVDGESELELTPTRKKRLSLKALETKESSNKSPSSNDEQDSGSSLPSEPRKPARNSRPTVRKKTLQSTSNLGTSPPNVGETSTNGTRGKKLGATMPTVTGKFNGDEMIIIENEMLKYREMHDMTTFEQNRLVQENASGASALFDEICCALPGRTRESIIKVCRRKFHNFDVRGRWTEDDDELLRAAYEQHPNKWKKISSIINRHPEDVRDRWRNYTICGGNLRKATWTDEEEKKLRAIVEGCLEDIRQANIEKAAATSSSQLSTQPEIDLVDWQTVSLRLGRTRSRLQCISKWKILQKREAPFDREHDLVEVREKSWRVDRAKRSYSSMSRADKYELLLAIQDSRAGTEGKVPWATLGNVEFQRKWPCMARKFAWKRLRAKVPGNENMKFQDIVCKLVKAYFDALVDDPPEIDAVTSSQFPQDGTEKPLINEEYVHTDAKEESDNGRKAKKQKKDKKTRKSEEEITTSHTKKSTRGDITHKRKKRLRERMAKAGESPEPFLSEVKVEEHQTKEASGNLEENEKYNSERLANDDHYQRRQSISFEETSNLEGTLSFHSPLANPLINDEVGVDGEGGSLLARRHVYPDRLPSIEL